MFSETSIIKEMNIINKFICYILVVICLLILKDPIFLTFVNIFLLLVNKDSKKLFTFNFLLRIFTITTIVFT